MDSPAEGIQIPINDASKAQLRAFLTHLGGKPANTMSAEVLIAKIRALDYDDEHIIGLDGGTTLSVVPSANAAAPAAGAKTIQEPTCDLTLHASEGPGGKRPVFVGVNGKALLIPRSKVSKNVKIRYLHALELAVETKYEFDEDAKANIPNDMPSYSFQVHRMPPQAEIDAWHAYEAKLEALANAVAAKKAA